MRVLVVNAGSSSLKLRLLGPNDTVEQSADTEPGGDLENLLRDWPQRDAVGVACFDTAFHSTIPRAGQA